ncbi:hypothetical protein [Pseudonocardia sp. DLS-67]
MAVSIANSRRYWNDTRIASSTCSIRIPDLARSAATLTSLIRSGTRPAVRAVAAVSTCCSSEWRSDARATDS